MFHHRVTDSAYERTVGLCQLALEGVTVTMKPIETYVPAPGNQLRDHNKRFENRPEDMKKDPNWRNNGIYEKISADNASERSTILMMDLAEVLGACREFSLPRDHDNSGPVGGGSVEDRPSSFSQGHVSF